MKKTLKLIMALLLAACLLAPAFALAEPAADRTVTLTVEKAQVMTGEMYRVFYKAPKAEEAYLYRSDAYEQNAVQCHVFNEYFGETGIDSFEYDGAWDVGAVTYRFAARFGDEWVETTAEVEAAAPNGPMPAPEVYVYPRQKLGENVDFTVEIPPEAENWTITVTDAEGREVISFASLPQMDYTVPAHLLTNGTYTITAVTRGIGYDGAGTASAEFYVGPPGKTITLAADKTEWLTYEKATLHLHAPDADEVILYGYEQMHWEHGMDGDVLVSFPYDGWQTFQLRARYGDEWVESAPLALQFAAPYGGEPPLSVHVRDIQPENEPLLISVDPVAGVTEFGLMIYGSDGTVYETQTYQESMTVPADQLKPGYYHLNAYMYAAGYLFPASADLMFHVGEIDRTVTLSIDHDPLLTWEPFALHCYAPEATEAVLYEIADDMSVPYEAKRWQGPVDESISYSGFTDTERSLAYLFMAWFMGSDANEASIIVKASAPYGERPPLTIPTAEVYDVEQEISIPIESERKLTLCYVNLLDGAGQWMNGIEYYQENTQTYVIPAGRLDPGSYQLEVTAFGAGYAERTIAYAPFKVGAENRDLILELKSPQPETGAGYTLRAGAYYADEWVLYRRDDDKEEERYYGWNTGVVRELGALSFGAEQSVYRLAARFGDEWLEAPPLTVRYAAPHGKMPAPVIHAPSAVPKGQEAMEFTVDTLNDLITLDVLVYNEKQEVVYREGYPLYREFSMAVASLPEGVYTIDVTVFAQGYAGVGHSQATFRIGDPAPLEPARYDVTGLQVEGSFVTGKLAHADGTETVDRPRVRVTFYITENRYFTTNAAVEPDGFFEAEGAGVIEYVTALAYTVENGERISLGAAEYLVE